MKFRYLVYDIETCVDKALLNKVCYAGLGLSDEQAYAAQMAELAADERSFVNPSFHRPISIAAVGLDSHFEILKIGLLGKPPSPLGGEGAQRAPRPAGWLGDEGVLPATQGDSTTPCSTRDFKATRALVEHFWEMYNQSRPVLIDFNGKSFDMRVLELWAFRLGIRIEEFHYDKFGPRYRFNEEHHLDLHEFLTNYGAVRWKGGLNLFSKILGKPGKMETKGEMVEELFAQGEHFRIDDYCLGDAMDTYFVFLRTLVLRGVIDLRRERELVEAAVEKMEAKQSEEGYFKSYLEAFSYWEPEAG